MTFRVRGSPVVPRIRWPRVLSDDEIRILIRKFDETRYGRAVRLLFLTGLRRDEVLGMKWSIRALGSRQAGSQAQ